MSPSGLFLDLGGRFLELFLKATLTIDRAFALTRAFGGSRADIRLALATAAAAETSEPRPIWSTGKILGHGLWRYGVSDGGRHHAPDQSCLCLGPCVRFFFRGHPSRTCGRSGGRDIRTAPYFVFRGNLGPALAPPLPPPSSILNQSPGSKLGGSFASNLAVGTHAASMAAKTTDFFISNFSFLCSLRQLRLRLSCSRRFSPPLLGTVPTSGDNQPSPSLVPAIADR